MQYCKPLITNGLVLYMVNILYNILHKSYMLLLEHQEMADHIDRSHSDRITYMFSNVKIPHCPDLLSAYNYSTRDCIPPSERPVNSLDHSVRRLHICHRNMCARRSLCCVYRRLLHSWGTPPAMFLHSCRHHRVWLPSVLLYDCLRQEVILQQVMHDIPYRTVVSHPERHSLD